MRCEDCKHSKGICKVCIKDKVFYLGVDLGKGDDETVVTNMCEDEWEDKGEDENSNKSEDMRNLVYR